MEAAGGSLLGRSFRPAAIGRPFFEVANLRGVIAFLLL
jgi:hypothetical protein